MVGLRSHVALGSLVLALITWSGQAQLRKSDKVSVDLDAATGQVAAVMDPQEAEAAAYLAKLQEAAKASDKMAMFQTPSSVARTESQPDATGTLHNWGQTYYFTPAKIVHAHSYDDVVQAVRDTATYPSPVRALGNIHSVSYLTVNQGGTVVLTRNLRGVKDFRYDERFGHQTVTVLTGTTHLEMYNWLGEKGYEAGFQAEIGDATVGSLSVSQNKDSGLFPKSEMGTTYKGIVALKYVDHEGNIREINAKDHASELGYFKSSDGLLGIVLEVTYKVFPQRLAHMEYRAYDTSYVIDNIHNIVTEDSSAWFLLTADTTYLEKRRYARADEQETAGLCRLMKEIKQIQFQQATMMIPEFINRNVPFEYTCYRRSQVVSYYNPSPGEKRQDFAWYEYPFERFQEVARDYVVFLRDFAARHNGFQITGAGVYFVERSADKPHGWFSQQGKGFDHQGLSFNMDPIFTNPRDPVWIEFINENTRFCLAHGGRTSLVQTRELTPELYFAAPGTIPLPEAPNKRFTTPFLEGFVEK